MSPRKGKKPSVILVSAEFDLIELIESEGKYRLAGYTDFRDIEIKGVPFLGTDEDYSKIRKKFPSAKFCLGIDLPKAKEVVLRNYDEKAFLSLVSRDARVSRRALIGVGCVLQSGVYLSVDAVLGRFVKVNVGAQIHHSCQIGDFSTIAPAAKIMGSVIIGNDCYIGAGAVIRQRVKIGAGSVVGAGAVVVDDVPEDRTVVGNPAKREL